jgi:hypothetical protein
MYQSLIMPFIWKHLSYTVDGEDSRSSGLVQVSDGVYAEVGSTWRNETSYKVF